MKKATRFGEDDVVAYPVDTNWCLAYQVKHLEDDLQCALAALEEIYHMVKINDAHYDSLSEELQQQLATEKCVATLARGTIKTITGRTIE